MRWLDLGAASKRPGAGLLWVLPVVLGLGCGGTVSDEPTNGGGAGSSTSNGGSGATTTAAGGGGAGGATVTTTSSTTTTTSSTTSTTTTTVSGDACAQACAELGDCGLPGDMCSGFLDCNNPQGQCAAECVTDPAIGCAEIFEAVSSQTGPLIDCVLQCQGSGQGGAGGMGQGGMGQGGGSVAECQQCGQDSCTNAFFQCAQSGGFQACQSWLGCAQGCTDKPCLDACTMMYPAAQPIANCLCTSCAGDCSQVCAGSGAGGMGQGGGPPMCDNCETLAFQGGTPCMGSDVLFADIKDCICTTACVAQCGNDCQNPNLNLQNVSLACQQCAGGAIAQACSAEWQACQNDPN